MYGNIWCYIYFILCIPNKQAVPIRSYITPYPHTPKKGNQIAPIVAMLKYGLVRYINLIDKYNLSYEIFPVAL